MEMNEVLEKLPQHLLNLVIEQPYNEYTALDHAVWRFVMRQNIKYLGQVAHGSYLDGLKKTGISLETIPHMYGMNRILKEIGWAAVAVDGFIPPAAFMEFQAYNVLVIAADIRPINQIEYTPAPDIIHEAAGHAPIIADEEYSEYLRRFGEIGSKAFSSSEDYKLYEAIRHLSILKADPYTPDKEIEAATQHLKKLDQNMGEISEMALIRNLHWWTVEYGLIGDLNNPKIYGAGLLSSIGESKLCLTDAVKKIPYTLDTKNYAFDITQPQPQLFVTPNFETLNSVLDEFLKEMALHRGGTYGLDLAIKSKNTATAMWSSGFQVSGIFSRCIEFEGNPAYVQTSGPTILCYRDKVIPGHDKSHHSEGFGSPAGKLKGINKPLEKWTIPDLQESNIKPRNTVNLAFESGVTVKGTVKKILIKDGNILMITFEECTVTHENEILFNPAWGLYDMAVGENIVSAYSGPADPVAYELKYNPPVEKTHKLVHSEKSKKLHTLYENVKLVREGSLSHNVLFAIWHDIKSDFPDEWLLPMEIYELVYQDGAFGLLEADVYNWLMERKEKYENLIVNGLALIQG